MTGNHIASTQKITMRPLAFQGIMVYESFPQITDMIRGRFGDEYALLFARPAENKVDGIIDWYTPVHGRPARLTAAPVEEHDEAIAEIGRMGRDILKFAEELANSGDPLKITRGNILKLALRYPDEADIYMVGDQPVLTCWGFGPGTPGVEAADITRISQEKPRLFPTQVHNSPTRPRLARRLWLWWLPPFLALLALLTLLFTGIDDREALSGHTLFHAPAPGFMRQQAGLNGEMAELEAQIAELRARLRDNAALCAPRSKRGGQATAPQQTEEKPKQEMVIPERAKDTAFLAGNWLCETGLVNDRTGEPVRVSLSFDKNGAGSATTYEKNDKCQGAAKARLETGILRIDIDAQSCAKTKTTYAPVTIECRQQAGVAICKGANEDGPEWNANFKKSR